MSSDAREERRKFVRIPQDNVVRFEPFTMNTIGSADAGGAAQSVIKNVSAGGVLFSSSQSFTVGELLKLEIELPGWEKFKAEFYKGDAVTRSNPVVVLASVVRVEVVEPEKVFDIGACFVGIDDGHQWALLKYVDAKTGKKTVS